MSVPKTQACQHSISIQSSILFLRDLLRPRTSQLVTRMSSLDLDVTRSRRKMPLHSRKRSSHSWRMKNCTPARLLLQFLFGGHLSHSIDVLVVWSELKMFHWLNSGTWNIARKVNL